MLMKDLLEITYDDLPEGGSLEGMHESLKVTCKLKLGTVLFNFSGDDVFGDTTGRISETITKHFTANALGEVYHDIMMSAAERENVRRFIGRCRQGGSDDRALLHLERLIRLSEVFEMLSNTDIAAWADDDIEPWDLETNNRMTNRYGDS